MAKGYVYTDLSAERALYLTMSGVEYEVSSCTISWALNEIPQARCTLAVGRLMAGPNADRRATIHRVAERFQMTPAQIWFRPRAEYNQRGGRVIEWPETPQRIFDGFLTGFGYNKVRGKIYVVANLIHWLVLLTQSSSLTANGHVANPTDFNAAAVLNALAGTGIGARPTERGDSYIGPLAPAAMAGTRVASDLWVAMKRIFCGLASIETMPVDPTRRCGGSGQFFKNDRALLALGKIEGEYEDTDKDTKEVGPGVCSVPYNYGVPLAMDVFGLDIISNSIGLALGMETVRSYSAMTFWDKMIAQFFPLFGMAIVPMVNSAVVIADTPAYNGGFWKTLIPEEVDAESLNRLLDRVLRAVGVIATFGSETGVGTGERVSIPINGGCHVEDSVTDADGMVMFIEAPSWLKVALSSVSWVEDTTGIPRGAASKTATTPAVGTKATQAFGTNLGELFARYAHETYVRQALRGKTGTISGMLRFDIAPGSQVKLVLSSETFLGAEDEMALTLFGCVSRVTVAINAEAPAAGTSFELTHLRTEEENKRTRTSVNRHPLFGMAIHGDGKHGCPLLPAYDLLP